MEVSNVDQLENAFKDAIKARSAALAVTSGPFNNSNHKRIAELAANHHLPAISPWGDFVAAGGLMSYGGDEAERYRRVAYLIDRILKGAKPAELPVERPMGFEFNDQSQDCQDSRPDDSTDRADAGDEGVQVRKKVKGNR